MFTIDRAWLIAAGFGALMLPLLFLARAAAKGSTGRRYARLARELGFRYEGPADRRADPRFSGIRLPGIAGRCGVAHVMTGANRGRDVILAEAIEGAPVSRTHALGFFLGAVRDGLRLMQASYEDPRRVWLLVIMPGALPDLPDLRADGPALEAERARRDAIARGADDDGPGPLATPEVLPEPFLAKAARVIGGRGRSWTLQISRGRMIVAVDRWRSGTTLRTARSTRDLLDQIGSMPDAIAGLDAYDDLPDRPAKHAAPIREALRHIREAGRGDASVADR